MLPPPIIQVDSLPLKLGPFPLKTDRETILIIFIYSRNEAIAGSRCMPMKLGLKKS